MKQKHTSSLKAHLKSSTQVHRYKSAYVRDSHVIWNVYIWAIKDLYFFPLSLIGEKRKDWLTLIKIPMDEKYTADLITIKKTANWFNFCIFTTKIDHHFLFL